MSTTGDDHAAIHHAARAPGHPSALPPPPIGSPAWSVSACSRRAATRDAVVAMDFVLQVVEPLLNGPGREVSAIFHSVATVQTEVLCGQGMAPAGGDDRRLPRAGPGPDPRLRPARHAGSLDAWMLLLRDHATIGLREALEPAIHNAEAGHPVLPRVAQTSRRTRRLFREEWPGSAATWLGQRGVVERRPRAPAAKAGESRRSPYDGSCRPSGAGGGRNERWPPAGPMQLADAAAQRESRQAACSVHITVRRMRRVGERVAWSWSGFAAGWPGWRSRSWLRRDRARLGDTGPRDRRDVRRAMAGALQPPQLNRQSEFGSSAANCAKASGMGWPSARSPRRPVSG
jgi:hypothetical protein